MSTNLENDPTNEPVPPFTEEPKPKTPRTVLETLKVLEAWTDLEFREGKDFIQIEDSSMYSIPLDLPEDHPSHYVYPTIDGYKDELQKFQKAFNVLKAQVSKVLKDEASRKIEEL